MHIFALLAAAAGAVLFLLLRMQQASRAVTEVAEAADSMRGLFRRLSWSRRANVNPLDAVTDPREAAAAMMVAVAEADGSVSAAEQTAIADHMRQHFDASNALCTELFGRGRWLVQGRANTGETLRRLAPAILKSCSPAERRDLIAMLRAVAAADGRGSEMIEAEIRRLAHHLELKA